MNTKYETLQKIAEAKIIAVIRGGSAEEAIDLSKAAIEGGIQAIEITYTTPHVIKVFQALEQEKALLGAGTVLDAETARLAITEGAKFIVSPHFNREVATLCNRYGIPYLPGCMTVNEMVAALESGCDVLKLFPANLFKPSFIRSVKGPLPNARLMPTGGIDQDNIKDWIDAGAFAVGVGSDLNKAYQQGGYQAVVELSRTYLKKLSA